MTNKVAHRIQHGRISTNVSMAQIRLPIHSYWFCSGQSYIQNCMTRSMAMTWDGRAQFISWLKSQTEFNTSGHDHFIKKSNLPTPER